MSSQEIPEETLPAGQDTAHGAVKVADDPFADPGLPPHKPRIQDIDERAARRSERAVAFMFVLSMLATVGFIASYVIFPVDKIVYIWPFGRVSALNFALGWTLGLALFFIGAGAVHWARTLMSDVEIALGRRKLIRNTMFGALSLVPLSASCCCVTWARCPRRSSGPPCGPRGFSSST